MVKKRRISCRLGETVSALITESRSCRSQLRWTGVCPRGAQVRRTSGCNMKPLSSTSTIVRRSRRAFFYCRPSFSSELSDGNVVSFPSQPRGLLGAETEMPQDSMNVRDVVPDAKLAVDDLRYALQRPQFVGPAPRSRSLDQERAQLTPLLRGEPCLSASLRLGVQPTLPGTLEGLRPPHHRRRHTANTLGHRPYVQPLLPQRHSRSSPNLQLLLAALWSHPIVRSDQIRPVNF
jgi:hypothetical protein